jgi:hypothetical protein
MGYSTLGSPAVDGFPTRFLICPRSSAHHPVRLWGRYFIVPMVLCIRMTILGCQRQKFRIQFVDFEWMDLKFNPEFIMAWDNDKFSACAKVARRLFNRAVQWRERKTCSRNETPTL